MFYKKRLCFEEAYLAVLPRTIYSWYYNQKVDAQCRAGTGSFVQSFGPDRWCWDAAGWPFRLLTESR